FFFSSRRRHTRSTRDWSSDVCSSDLGVFFGPQISWDSVAKLALVFREARQEASQAPGTIGASRALIVGANRQAAATAARAYLEKIGRASCRERGVIAGRGVVRRRKTK